MINRIKDARDRLYYTVRTKEDFANSFFGALVPTYVDSLPLAINQWTYIDELQAARFNVDEGTNGWIRFETGEFMSLRKNIVRRCPAMAVGKPE